MLWDIDKSNAVVVQSRKETGIKIWLFFVDLKRSSSELVMQQADSRSSSSSSAAATPNTHVDSSQNNTSEASKAARLALEGEINDILQVLFELSVVVFDFQQPEGNHLIRDKM